ncbi:VanZ family protein [Streptomyces sp. NRRL S-31]|uniref:VanZ family protein n=1 Tax=Streptomyces sp. NRRL S-31 TaxID=1463898 RepID=UPI00131D2F12|nr:VanZ family protein [Streptomyces sp. NRRL S-31]
MIEASVSAVPRLVISFLILAIVLAVPTALVARSRGKAWPIRTALAVYLAGIVTVTLLPGNAGLESGQCDVGMPIHLLTSAGSLLNISLFAPGAFLAVLIFRRPVTVAATLSCLSATVELVQSVANIGRACSLSDITANVTGAVLGSLIGAIWVYQRRQAPRRPGRDLLWGALVLAVGTTSAAWVMHSRIESVDVVAMDDQRHRFTSSAVQADDWITSVAKGIYGDDVEMLGTVTEKEGSRLKITANTNRGSISGWWPERDIDRAWSSNTRGEEGGLNHEQVATIADDFARKWIPKNFAGSQRKIRPIGESPTTAYEVTYRRYAQGVLLPMRLDLTVTAAGRVIGFTAKTVEDPALPRVTMNEAKARALASSMTGTPSESALLLAQQIRGDWRPVWLVGSGNRDVAFDAATGERITIR